MHIGDGVDDSLARRERTGEELDPMVGNTMESPETWRKNLIQNMSRQEGEKISDYVAKSNKGDPQITDTMRDPSKW